MLEVSIFGSTLPDGSLPFTQLQSSPSPAPNNIHIGHSIEEFVAFLSIGSLPKNVLQRALSTIFY